jgi:hypothetical protein
VEIVVSHDRLPSGEIERSTFLKRYFCELAVTAKETADGWSLSLGRPTREDFYIDPELARGLEWWSDRYGKVDVAGIPFAVHAKPGLQLSLNDSWTIYSWSRWLKDSGAPGTGPDTITLLHLDDHDDLMSPRLLIERDAWLDPISQHAVDLWKPDTLESAIRSGAIGIGSFMAPLLHHLPSVDVRHLCSTEYAKERQGPYLVRPVSLPDDLLAPGSSRPAVELRRVEEAPDARGEEGHPYLVTDDLDTWLAGLPEGPVLVHIDMDYFNNRFNGDSDWVDYGPKYDPPLHDVLARIDQVFRALEVGGIVERIEDFAVALSPGFFPADLWAPSIERIEAHVDRLIAAGRWAARK